MIYLASSNNDPNKFSPIKCCICSIPINQDTQIYYVFIGRSKTTSNEPFCVDCYLADVRKNQKLDPFKNPVYHKNFIRMNK